MWMMWMACLWSIKMDHYESFSELSLKVVGEAIIFNISWITRIHVAKGYLKRAFEKTFNLLMVWNQWRGATYTEHLEPSGFVDSSWSLQQILEPLSLTYTHKSVYIYILMIYKISWWSYIDVKISKMKAYVSKYLCINYVNIFYKHDWYHWLFSHNAHVPLTLQPASFTTLSSSTKVCYTLLQAPEGWNCYGWWFRHPAHQLVRGHITLIEVITLVTIHVS